MPVKQEKSFRECMAAVWKMSRAVRWRMAVSVVIGLVRIAASLGFVWASKQLVDIATHQNSMPLATGIGIFVGILLLQIGTFILLELI